MPSADNETDVPTFEPETLLAESFATSLALSVQVDAERVKIQPAPGLGLAPFGWSPGPPISAVLPSDESETLVPK